MATNENSFDVVSNVDLQEVRNAVNQAEKEIVLEAADEYSLNQALEVLKTKMVRREVQLKSLRYGKVEPASGGRARQKITLQQGIPTETAKKLVAEIKQRKLKVQ